MRTMSDSYGRTSLKSSNMVQLLTILFLAIATAYYIDVVSYSKAGFIISWIIILALFFISLFSYSWAVVITVCLLAITPFYARQIYQIYQVGGQWAHLYSTPLTVKLLGISLVNWLFIWLGLAGIIYLWMRRESLPKDIINLLFIVLLGIPILIVGLLYQDTVYWRDVLSTFQYPILLPLGAIAGWRLVKEIRKQRAQKSIYQVLWLAFVISGLRAILFLVSDYYNGTFNLDLATEKLIFIPLLFACLAERQLIESKWKLLILLALSWLVILPTGRNIWILLIANTILLFTFFAFRATQFSVLIKTHVARRIGGLILVGLFVFAVVSVLNPSIYKFILFKLLFFKNLFVGNLSESPVTRIYEFKNITAELWGLGLPGILFGKGAGGYFTFAHYAPSFNLGISAYSAMERSQGIFFNPHTFVNYWLLKGGIIGLGWYIASITYAFILALKKARTGIKAGMKYNLALWLVFFCPVVFFGSWMPSISFLFGLVSGIVMAKEPQDNRRHSAGVANLYSL